jgi:DUF1680 family protein
MKNNTNFVINRRSMALGLTAAPWLLSDIARAGLPGMAPLPPAKVKPFAFSAVRLLDGPCRDALSWNRIFLMQLDVDRLLHVFRLSAGLATTAQPYGGWEKPDCELRGHFVGHYLSACALMFASDSDTILKQRGDAVVSGLAACQKALNQDGYLSAYPLSYFDRLDARTQVWAPFYTLHKIMAGLYDMHVHTGNAEALTVLLGMAAWADNWSAAKSRPHMQQILDEEFGGMGEVFYNLAALTNDGRWQKAGDRFIKDKFVAPLTAHRDALKGLHVNTHIPQVIASARRYEIADDWASKDIADFFWNTVVSGHSYVTGGTSNGECWQTGPGELGKEWVKHTTHAECCCAYNMMKLSRHLFSWTADSKYMDYYERLLFNHRLGTIEPGTGRVMYYLSLTPGAWKVFGNDDATFWCCTGTGAEEYAKLTDTIYFHDETGLYVNQFIASKLDWAERGIAVEQSTRFPEEGKTTLTLRAAPAGEWPLHLRIPAWTKAPRVLINGKQHPGAVPGRYLTIQRAWKAGDSITLDMPMTLHSEGFADQPGTQAVMVGPIVLAGQFAMNGAGDGPHKHDDPAKVPPLEKWPLAIPKPKLNGKALTDLVHASGEPLRYTLLGPDGPIPLKPLYQSWERYTVYWETV